MNSRESTERLGECPEEYGSKDFEMIIALFESSTAIKEVFCTCISSFRYNRYTYT
jgi:hypothetical protein